MKIIKTAIVMAFVALSCSGCEIYEGAREAMRGGPWINANVFMGRNGGRADGRGDIPSVIPLACRPSGLSGGDSHDDLRGEKENAEIAAENVEIEAELINLNDQDLNKCVDAMKLLIDTRWARFEHVLNGSLSTTNFLADATVTGLAASIPLVAPGTKSVLGAITSGITGTRKNWDEDILYSYSIQSILQQMRKDRALKADEIERHLTGVSRPYRNMSDAAVDLFEYDQAGSWEHAMASLQTNLAAQTAACQARLRDQKLEKVTDTLPAGQTPTSTATDPCNAPVAAASFGESDLKKDTKFLMNNGILIKIVTEKDAEGIVTYSKFTDPNWGSPISSGAAELAEKIAKKVSA